MGLKREYVDFVFDAVGNVYGKFMLEIGNQKVREDVETDATTGKEFWESLGVAHTSIDINGADGAINFDLSKTVDRFQCAFDVVTDIGTSCYIQEQHVCFKNLYSFAKIGGVIIHILPAVGSRWTSLRYETLESLRGAADNYGADWILTRTIAGEFGDLVAIASRKR